MSHFLKRWFRRRSDASLRRREIAYRPLIEQLEERVMLDAGLPPALVVGRTLSSYFVGGIQNQHETITYTVYNEQANPVTGVLLTDTLQPGVTFQSASQLPDQSGQKLAWSLGTIQGFDRESVTLTVSLPNSIPFQLDSGAKAFATLNAGLVSNSTSAATLQPGSINDIPGGAALLNSTPDTDATNVNDTPNLPISDPFVQEEAAALGYNAQNIFNFLENDIGYNSYLGSVRGARGTLWSSAGNALDVASLGVALMRASGIPAQYVSGTLSQSQAQQLIRSMFPASFQTVGYIPAGSHLADPANDPQLLAETENHFWFQFNTGSGMTDADPLMAAVTSGGHVGQAFTASTGTFAEVPDNLREKTEVSLTAEIYNQAAAVFGLNPYTETVVLDQTFNDVNLVGRPLSVGTFVSSDTEGGLGFGATTNTYSPYLTLGDEAFPDPSQNEVIHGQAFQEYITSFPLGSQFFTGLFLNFTLSGPQGTAQTYSATLLDRIGYDVRQNGGSLSLALSANSPTALSPAQVWSIDVLPGLQDEAAAIRAEDSLENSYNLVGNAVAANDLTDAAGLLRNVLVGQTQAYLADFVATSDLYEDSLAAAAEIKMYSARPRIAVISANVTEQNSTPVLSFECNLLDDSLQTVVYPGQTTSVLIPFEGARGIQENVLETNLFPQPDASSGIQVQAQVSTSTAFDAAAAQGIPLVALDPSEPSLVDQLNIDAVAKARITTALQAGLLVIVPTQDVMIGGAPTNAWYQINLQTGDTIGVGEDGAHQSLIDFAFAGAPPGVAASAGNAQKDLLDRINGTVKATEIFTFLVSKFSVPQNKKGIQRNFAKARVIATVEKEVQEFEAISREFKESEAFLTAFTNTLNALFAQWAKLFLDNDPPVLTSLFNNTVGLSSHNLISETATVAANRTAGTVNGNAQTNSVAATGNLQTSWSNSAASSFVVGSLSASVATVQSGAAIVGSGTVALAESGNPVQAGISGSDNFSVTGNGSLAFYGPAESSLGVSGNWTNYAASITGQVTITLTTDSLTLNGKVLPAGTYTITTSAATLSGSGLTTSPNFSGSVAITATSDTIDLGAGSGALTVGGKPVDPSSGVTLDGYTGSISVTSGGGSNLDHVTLKGNTANVLTVSATPNTLTTDQNTPKTFQVNVNTSFADSYTLVAQAPAGWTVSIDSNNNVTVTPAAGLQSGTYPIQVVAQSTTDPNLVAQTTVNVTITPTVAGMTFTVQPDPLLTVPFGNAQVPTAFQAVIHNDGPAADTYNLTFANIPAGFTLLDSGTSVTVPAGQTGIVGLYLQPTGTSLLPPGTPLSFDVTATSTTNPTTITKKVTESFDMPTVDGVTLSSNPAGVTSSPGVATTATLTLQDVGNVPETVTLTDTAAAGLTISQFTPVSLAVGQTKTVTVTCTPAANAALNSTLATTFTATYGPVANPQTATTEVDVQVVSVQVVALSQAATAAGALASDSNDLQLSQTLTELQSFIVQLQASPTNGTVLSDVQFELGNVSTLLNVNGDPNLTALVPQLQTLQNDANAGNVSGLLLALPTFFNNLTGILTVEATEQFTLSMTPSEVDLGTGQSQVFPVQLTNTGPDPVTLTLSAANVPTGVSAQFAQTQVTLAVGATQTVNLTLTQTQEVNVVFALAVTAAASVAQQTATAVVTIHPAIADVISVTANPQQVNPGDPVAVTAQVFNTANVDRSEQAQLQILDASGNVLSTLPLVPVTLVPGTNDVTVDLGQVPTTGLANGVYSLEVSLLTPDGTPLPGHSSQAVFGVGQTVTASAAASPTIVPPGTSTVSTTISVNNQSGSSGGGGSGGSVTPPITVEVGYADGLRANGFFPNPWDGAPNTVFVGDDASNVDGGAILIINNGTAPITVNDVSVTLSNGVNLDLWGSNVVPAGDNLVLSETTPNNFDTSDYDDTTSPPGYPDGETAHAARVNITLNGVAQPTLLDTGHVLTTGGFDLAQLGNESQNWRPIGTTGIDNLGGSAVSAVVTDNLPASGYTVDPTSINPAATSSSSSQVVWSGGVLSSSVPSLFQLTGTVSNMAPGEVRQISTGTNVAVTTTTNSGQQLTSTITLPPLTVAAEHIISLTPPTQTTDRNTMANYTVVLTNPLPTDETYSLSVAGLTGFTTRLAGSVLVPAGQTVDVPLQVTVPAGAIPGTDVFEVDTQTAAGASDSVEGQLTVAPTVALPSVQLALRPAQATAGQGTSATYTVTVTNRGNLTDTYNLGVTGLPTGVNASFSTSTITVPPGTSNFRDITLTLTPAAGTKPGPYAFQVTATSTTQSSVTASASGTLKVVSQGVAVTLTSTSGAPGSTFSLKVTNTSTAKDTFDLSLGGPGALVSKLALTKVTLAPGASTTVTITTGAITFAVSGALPLVASAKSEGNPAVEVSATAPITVPATMGMTAQLSPGVQVIPVPGTSNFLLLVNNTGNSEDAYTATITGTSGPVKAQLMGLDGLPTNTIPTFRLPGLSTGALLLETDLAAFATGTVTIEIDSLTDPAIKATVKATVKATPPPPPLRRGRAFG